MMFAAGLSIFVVTAVIGILNGLDVVTFSRAWVVTHVHAGTLGWITLAMMGAAIWMFAQRFDPDDEALSSETVGDLRVRGLAIFSIVAIALYVAAFASGITWLRPIVGLLTIVASVLFLLWMIRRARLVGLDVARLGMIMTVTFLILGGLLGILLGLAMAEKFGLTTERFAGSHPASMVAGFLVLGGATLAEWLLEPEGRRIADSRAGVVQVILLFVAGTFLALGELLKVQALLMLNLPCLIAGIVIVLVRLRKHFRGMRWLEATAGRHIGLALAFLVVNVGLVVYAIALYAEDFSKVPTWLIFALDHLQFVGVVTNVLLATLLIAMARTTAGRPLVDHIAFWFMNAGMVGFVIGIMLDSAPLKRIFAPVMGLAILVAVGANLIRMREATQVADTAVTDG